MLELFQLWAFVEGLGLLCLPLTFTVFRNLPDRGWTFSKILGMVVLAFSVWLPLMCLHFLPYSQLFIAGILLILAACSGPMLLKMYPEIVQMAWRNRSYIIITELVFLAMMTLLGWLRSFNPAISGFEMFMDEGFVAAIMRSPHLPPNDMWFSGYSINYYYYSHYMIATLAKLLGQSPSIAFNTGICLFFGLAAVNLYGITCNIVAWARQARSVAIGHVQGKSTRHTIFAPELLRATPFGLISVLMGLILGNLAATQQWWDHHGDVGFHFDWFMPSRVIPNTINEFPAFSFILSCFHAHVLTLSFTILCIGLALNWLLEPEGQGLAVFGRGWRIPLNLSVTAIVLGGLFTMNGWDYPTYMGLVLVCVLLQQGLVHKSLLCFAFVRDLIIVAFSLIALSYLFYLPFYLIFNSPSQGIGFADPAYRSALSDELLIYGIFAFVFLSLLLGSVLKSPLKLRAVAPLSNLAAMEQSMSSSLVDVSKLALVAVTSNRAILKSRGGEPGGTTAASVARGGALVDGTSAHSAQSHLHKQNAGKLTLRLVMGMPCVFLLMSIVLLKFMPSNATLIIGEDLAFLGAVLTFYHIHNRAHAFTLLLGATAFIIIAGCEVFYLKDIWAGGGAERMNTIFKFYFQAWALLSICSGAGLFFILDSFRSVKSKVKAFRWMQSGAVGVWGGILLLLVLAGMVYPIYASYSRYSRSDAQHPQPYMKTNFDLDGMTYLAGCQTPDCDFNTFGDYKAIRWLNEQVVGDPVIVESLGDDYHYNGRVSVFTGLPSPMGWVFHEWQWRINWINQANTNHRQQFAQRRVDIEQIYTNTSSTVVLDLMQRYNARYLYVGPLEYKKYPDAKLDRFGSFMQTVYSADGVTIYKVS